MLKMTIKCGILLLAFLTAVNSAQAATFTVDSVLDTSDSAIDGICDDGAGNCTLRAAIQEAEATAAPDSIDFAVTPFNGAVKTITPASPLPDIYNPVNINGYTQPGSSANTMTTADNAVLLIELNGMNAGANANGLHFIGGSSSVSGLIINRFSRSGIFLTGDSNVITGNFIGTDATGMIDLGNGSSGIESVWDLNSSSGNLIGGFSADRNIISGNGYAGVSLEFASSNNVIRGNFVGLAADGLTALGNDHFGISVGSFSSGNLIGGDDGDDGTVDGAVNARNYISGNGDDGIFLGGWAFNGCAVKGNYIGTDTTGTKAVGNAGSGIETNLATGAVVGGSSAGSGNLISGNGVDGINIGNTGSMIIMRNRIGTKYDGTGNLGNSGDGIEIYTGGGNNRIGGAGKNDGNTIAFNGEDGIQVTDAGFAPTGNPFLGNSIFSNKGMGINLGLDLVTANDAGDGDTGANNLQNFPVITNALSAGTIIDGSLNSVPGTTFRIEFFVSQAADPTGHGEGKLFIGALTVVTNGAGDAIFSNVFGGVTPLNSYVSATATNTTTGDTSEFSNSSLVH